MSRLVAAFLVAVLLCVGTEQASHRRYIQRRHLEDKNVHRCGAALTEYVEAVNVALDCQKHHHHHEHRIFKGTQLTQMCCEDKCSRNDIQDYICAVRRQRGSHDRDN